MNRTIWKLLTRPLFVLVLVLGACSDQGTMQLLGPSEQPSESLSLIDDLHDLLNGEKPDLSARHNSAIIGPRGGFVYVDLHYLYVPRGAVSGPTLFEMRLRDDYGIGASLTATSVDKHGHPTGAKNDVGSAGFHRPVYLTFSYAFATNVPSDPNDIKIVEIQEGGNLVPQDTRVNRWFRSATGTLHHFSDYGLAWPRTRTR